MPDCGDRMGKSCTMECACYDVGFIEDCEAWRYLEGQGYTQDRFLIKKPEQGHEPTAKDIAAICYLVNVWDWGYQGFEQSAILPGSDGGDPVFPKITGEQNAIDLLTKRVKKLEDWQHDLITTSESDSKLTCEGWRQRALTAEKAYESLLREHNPKPQSGKAFTYEVKGVITGETKSTDALACPFCSGIELELIYSSGGIDGSAVFIRCEGCGAEGPKTKNEGPESHHVPQAVNVWNKGRGKR